jgi:hypothetical protein
MRTATISLILLLFARALPGQEIRARVVDEPTRQPLAGATVTLLAGEAVLTRVVTDASGFFRVKPARAGDYTISIELLGYAVMQRAVTFADKELTLPAFVLTPSAVPLAPVEATGRREAAATSAVVGFTRASHVFAGSRMARMEQQSARPITLVREINGLRVREFKTSTGQPVICVESTRRMTNMRTAGSGCEWPVIIIDGVKVADQACDFRSCEAQQVFRELQLRDMESFEYLTPAEAGQQYGMSAGAAGALVIWTRGRGPHKSAARDSVRD